MSNLLYPRIVKVRLSKDDPDLSHEFKGWEGQNTLVFEAGLSETINTYRYNIETGDFKGAAPFEGVVSTSDIKIVVFPKK
jgi:hypothetical protein